MPVYNPPAAAGSSGLTALTEQATTSGTAIDFTIPAGATMVVIGFSGVSLSGTDSILVQLGDSGGVEATGYNSGSHNNSHFLVTNGFNVKANGATGTIYGQMVLTKVDDHVWVAQYGGCEVTSNFVILGGGHKELSAELTTVRITRDGANTFDAGALNVSYM